jgi:hypothetical protein
LLLGKDLPLPLDRRLGGPQKRYDKRTFFNLLGLEFWPFGHPACGQLLYEGLSIIYGTGATICTAVVVV